MKLKAVVREGARETRKESFKEKELQSEITSKFKKEDYRWLEGDSDPRKMVGIFNMQEQMVETRVWKKMRGISDIYNYRLCGERKETVQHLLARCKKLA